MAKIEIKKTEFVWSGKYDEDDTLKEEETHWDHCLTLPSHPYESGQGL